MEISHQKTKIIAFKGIEPIRSKIVIDNTILEQVNTFTYLGCNISYQEEKDTHSKITKFLQILGLLNNTLKPNLLQRSTRLKLYKTSALTILLYGSEILTIKECDKNRLRTAEMKYLRRTAGHTFLNHKRNEEILEELHVTPLEDKLCTYRHKWFQHVLRMEDNRLPEQLLNYHPIGRRRTGRPLKTLLDDMTAETETGHPGLNS
jgi:hypothetical protein